MKFLLFLVSSVVIAHGCKPADRSQSENKGFANIGKKIAAKTGKFGKLTDEAEASIKTLSSYVAKKKDSQGLAHMKKALAKGGSISDEAILVYVRSYKDRIREWDELIELSREKIARLPVPAPTDILKEIHNHVFIETDVLIRRLDWRVTQVEDMLDGIDPKRAESLANKLLNLDNRKTANDSSIQFIKGVGFFPKRPLGREAVRGSSFVARLKELNLYTRFQKLATKEDNLISKYSNLKNLTPIE